jgi:hypothetical protein
MQRRKKKDMKCFLQMVKMLQALCMAWLNKHRNKETRKLYLTPTHNTIWIGNFKFHSTSPLGREKKPLNLQGVRQPPGIALRRRPSHTGRGNP